MRYILLLLAPALLLFSCVGIAPTKEIQEVNSLNDYAYEQRYNSLSDLYNYSNKAYVAALNYKDGKAEACNNLGFYYYMQMDFEKSIASYKETSTWTINQLELLVADIGMMRIAQRTAQNKLFYDYRNSALIRMKRIKEDQSVFDSERDKIRLNYAFSEFYMVSVVYFYYLQQMDSAFDAVNLLADYERDSSIYIDHKTDVGQLLYYNYIKASTGLIKAKTPHHRLLHTYDLLIQIFVLASENHSIYFQGNALQSIANLMAPPESYAYLKQERGHTFTTFNLPLIDNFPKRLASRALELFTEFDDMYQMASTNVTLAKIDNYRGEFRSALKQLTSALSTINKQHHLYYQEHHKDEVDSLLLYDDLYESPLELKWINEGVLTVPDWIGRAREQLSVTYAGLNNKAASDYNRNAYLDILDLVRQDKEVESRYSLLQEEEVLVNSLLTMLVVFLVFLALLFYFLNRRARIKTTHYVNLLKKCLNIGQELTASLPVEVVELEDVLNPITSIIKPFLLEDLGVKHLQLNVVVEKDGEQHYTYNSSNEDIEAKYYYEYPLTANDGVLKVGMMKVFLDQKLTIEQNSFISLLIPSITWAIENGVHFIDLGVEKDMLDKQLYISNQHNMEHRRENINKRSCMRIVYGIQPYIDRIRNEIDKLTTATYAKDDLVKSYKITYIEELISTIDTYNDVLSVWIKMGQGALNLQISSFNLSGMFSLVKKGSRPFEQKEIALEVACVDVDVKADRALTLFMINTLLENARKYTQPGGKIKLYTDQTADYVEVIVEDSGVGLTSEEVNMILTEKVYDSALIGKDDAYVKSSKGGGFGLMNCKAIIDKYRKTNPIFSVCKFNIQSEKGKGSKFSFRLPYGVRKVLMTLFVFVGALGLASCSRSKQDVDLVYEDEYNIIEEDSLVYEALQLADSAFYANRELKHAKALRHIEQAMSELNSYYLLETTKVLPRMNLNSDDVPAEISWFKAGFELNYYLVLDLRNEAAVASLALHDMGQYNYNNQAYTTLYKLLSKDESLDYYCKIIQQSTSNKRVVITILLGSMLIALFIYYFVYLKRRYMRRWSLEQVLDIYERFFSSSLMYIQHDDGVLSDSNLSEVPTEILKNSFTQINNLIGIDWMTIALYDMEKEEFVRASYPIMEPELSDYLIEECFRTKTQQSDRRVLYVPLTVSLKQSTKCIGVVIAERRFDGISKEEELYVQLIVKYLSTVLYNTMIRTAGKFREIEFVQNDIARLEWENNIIHIQNKILENCLSAIKHETIYYPSRLKQLLGEVQTKSDKADIMAMQDLVEYYYGVFTTLSLWAKQELEHATFRRSTLLVSDLVDYIRSYYTKKVKRAKIADISFHIEQSDKPLAILGDDQLLEYLLELLIDDALSLKMDGNLSLKIVEDKQFIHFEFEDDRTVFTKQELENLFYPNKEWIKAAPQKGVSGQTFLIAKEIIREHDEYIGRRGCKIRTSPLEKGYKLIFSIVKK